MIGTEITVGVAHGSCLIEYHQTVPDEQVGQRTMTASVYVSDANPFGPTIDNFLGHGNYSIAVIAGICTSYGMCSPTKTSSPVWRALETT